MGRGGPGLGSQAAAGPLYQGVPPAGPLTGLLWRGLLLFLTAWKSLGPSPVGLKDPEA